MANRGKKVNNSYKSGRLSRAGRFSRQKVNPTPIIVLVCVLVTFILAMVLGNYLGDIAEQSQNTTTKPSNSSQSSLPTVDKVNPTINLNGYFADMTGADPEESLSLQTESARNSGNALYIELIDADGKLIYTSDTASEIGYPTRDHLTLSRLSNHLAYYDDYAVAHFKSGFSASLDATERVRIQSDEILIIAEACDGAFSEVIVEFDGSLTKNNIIHYQSYLLNLKLACPGVPIGIKLSYSFLANSENSGLVADIMVYADYYVFNIGELALEGIDGALSPIVYLLERYENTVMLAKGNGESADLVARIEALRNKGVESYIIK